MSFITNVKSKASDVRDAVIKKAVPLTVSAVAGANLLVMSACAEETGVDLSAVTDSMTSSLTDLVSKAALACAAVVGAGLTIF